MSKGKSGIRPVGADKSSIVEPDDENPVLQRAQQLVARAVIKERLAAFAQAQAMDLGGAEVGDDASGLWDEMPLAAKEYEASRMDAGDGENVEGGGVPAC